MLDIRTLEEQKPRLVRFADPDSDYANATLLFKDEEDMIFITDEEYESMLILENESAATSLISALQYAIDNKWWRDE